MKGKKYTKYTELDREKARALFATGMSLTNVSKSLNVPITTLKGWSGMDAKDPDIEKLRNEKKKEFIEEAWAVIRNGTEIVKKRLIRAREYEEEIDKLIQSVCNVDMTTEEKKSVLDKLKILKCEDLTKVTTAIGTLYDKQALANKEATQVIDSEVKVIKKKFEDL